MGWRQCHLYKCKAIRTTSKTFGDTCFLAVALRIVLCLFLHYISAESIRTNISYTLRADRENSLVERTSSPHLSQHFWACWQRPWNMGARWLISNMEYVQVCHASRLNMPVEKRYLPKQIAILACCPPSCMQMKYPIVLSVWGKQNVLAQLCTTVLSFLTCKDTCTGCLTVPKIEYTTLK